MKDTRVRLNTFIATAVLPSLQTQKIWITDLHVALAHSHEVTLRAATRQMGVNVSGELESWAGCSEA